MLVIGLTGGSGVGKGCVSRSLLRYGIEAIDTDQTARSVCEKGSPCLNELVTAFGDGILNSDGTLNRPALAALAFSDVERHKTLNKITHFHILNQARIWLDGPRKAGKPAAVVDAPLLFESGVDGECDVIIAVTAPRDQRIKRLLARDSVSLEAIELRLSKQKDDGFYTEKADFVIENNGSLEEIDRRVDEIVRRLFPHHTAE